MLGTKMKQKIFLLSMDRKISWYNIVFVVSALYFNGIYLKNRIMQTIQVSLSWSLITSSLSINFKAYIDWLPFKGVIVLL